MTASEIIAKFGSIAELGRVLDVPMTTVSSWGLANQIPTWRQLKILEAAAARGIDLSIGDFPPIRRRDRLEGSEAA
jgi:hypothetical protein